MYSCLRGYKPEITSKHIGSGITECNLGDLVVTTLMDNINTRDPVFENGISSTVPLIEFKYDFLTLSSLLYIE